MHTIQEIINNQEEFKEQILSYFLKEYNNAQKELGKIECDDNFILNEKEKLQQKFKTIKPQKYIEQLFFMHSKRNKVFYVWWDKEENEAKILKYDKR